MGDAGLAAACEMRETLAARHVQAPARERAPVRWKFGRGPSNTPSPPRLLVQFLFPDKAQGVEGKDCQAFLGMMRDGLIWVKLSHPYHIDDHPPYAAVTPFAHALVDANPKRCVFGFDWPHPGHQPHPPMPDDGALLDLFPKWVPDPKLQQQILVDNAAEIYGY